jgi:hypothetical protein
MKNETGELLPRSGWPDLWCRLDMLRRLDVLPTLGDLLLALVYGLFLRISIGAAVHGDVGTLILAIQELSIVVLVLTCRAHVAVAGDSLPAVLAWCGTILPLLLCPAMLAPVLFVVFGNAIQLAGGLLVLDPTIRHGCACGTGIAYR